MTPLRELYELYRYPDVAKEARRRELLAEIPTDARDEDNEARTSLHVAAEFADREAITSLIGRGAEVNARDAAGRTPLLCLALCRSGRRMPDDEIADAGRRLLELGANLPRSGRNTTALIEAARNRYHGLIAALVDSGQRLDSTDRNGDNALHVLCQRVAETTDDIRRAEQRIEGFAERWTSEKQKADTQRELEAQREEAVRCHLSVALLLDSGQFDLGERNAVGRTPFDLAAAWGANTVSALLSGEDPYDERALETGGMNLFLALRRRDWKTFEKLLAAGADRQEVCDDPEMSDFTGKPPLLCALMWGETEAAALLLRAGADPNRRTEKGESPFGFWIERGCRGSDGMERYAPLLELFVRNGWHPDAPQAPQGESALMLTCRHDDCELAMWTLRRLLGQKIEVNARDALGRTTLMHLLGPGSAGPYQFEMLERLLGAGADPCAVDNEGRTVLHYVAEGYSHPAARQAAELLFDFGRPDVSAADNRGLTSLNIAMRSNNETLVRYFLKKL